MTKLVEKTFRAAAWNAAGTFGAALIQKPAVTREDESAVFHFNMVMAFHLQALNLNVPKATGRSDLYLLRALLFRRPAPLELLHRLFERLHPKIKTLI